MTRSKVTYRYEFDNNPETVPAVNYSNLWPHPDDEEEEGFNVFKNKRSGDNGQRRWKLQTSRRTRISCLTTSTLTKIPAESVKRTTKQSAKTTKESERDDQVFITTTQIPFVCGFRRLVQTASGLVRGMSSNHA